MPKPMEESILVAEIRAPIGLPGNLLQNTPVEYNHALTPLVLFDFWHGDRP